jgi:hypothetical protein
MERGLDADAVSPIQALIIFIISIGLVSIFVCSCGPSAAEREERYVQERQQAKEDSLFREQNKGRIAWEALPEDIHIITVDSCQYILYPQVHKYLDYNRCVDTYTTHTITHKANCNNPMHQRQLAPIVPVKGYFCHSCGRFCNSKHKK